MRALDEQQRMIRSNIVRAKNLECKRRNRAVAKIETEKRLAKRILLLDPDPDHRAFDSFARDSQHLCPDELVDEAERFLIDTTMQDIIAQSETVSASSHAECRRAQRFVREISVANWVVNLNTENGVTPGTDALNGQMHLLGDFRRNQDSDNCIPTKNRLWACRFRRKWNFAHREMQVHGGGDPPQITAKVEKKVKHF